MTSHLLAQHACPTPSVLGAVHNSKTDIKRRAEVKFTDQRKSESTFKTGVSVNGAVSISA